MSAGHRADSKFPLNGRQTAVISGFFTVAPEHWAEPVLPPSLSAFQFLGLLDSPSFWALHYRWFHINRGRVPFCIQFAFKLFQMLPTCTQISWNQFPCFSDTFIKPLVALWWRSVINKNKWIWEKKSNRRINPHISDFLKPIIDPVLELLTL